MRRSSDDVATARGIGLPPARLETPILELWTRAGTIEAVGSDHLHVDLRDAVADRAASRQMSTVMDALGPVRRPPTVSWRDIVRTVLHVVVSIVALGSVYFLAPLEAQDATSPVLVVGGATVLTAAIGTLQVRAILRSARPTLRAVEALAFSIPLLILSFAAIYFVMSQADGGAFTEPLTRVDALYFAVTVFATVGFGDIAPAGQTARMAVTGQMVCNLLVLGIGLRVVVGAVQLSRRRQE